MTSEWDGTAWGGTPVSRAESAIIPHEGMAIAAKAATGWQNIYNGVNPMLRDVNRSPSAIMREAQGLYHVHPWIRRAEATVTSKVAGLPWHLEDENDDEVDDETTNPALEAIQTLLEKPQDALPIEQRQPGIQTWRGLISITSRHMGLCGPAYWFLDQMDKGGLPLALLYINPARLQPTTTKRGYLTGYTLDADDYGNGGTPLRVDQVLAFYLDVPDFGAETTGLVAAAALKARIVTASDVHVISVLGTGGRIAGLISPKTGYIDDDEKFAQMERDFRNVNEAPDAAKRMTIIRGAMDFTQTGANPEQLGLSELGSEGRSDIFAIWGVPPSQAGIPHAAGLNSGSTGQNEYEVLMTGAVHDRVRAIWEPIQYDLLDRWKTEGLNPELEIEEPEFDDEGPAYTIAAQAISLPLTNNERRDIIGKDPLPDYGPDGEPLGAAIWVPSTITAIAQGPEDGATPDNPWPNAPKPEPPPEPPPVQLGTLQPPPPPQIGTGLPPVAAKAGAFVPAPTKRGGFLGLRRAVDQRMVPAAERAVQQVLRAQREDVAQRLASATPRQLRDESYWWRGDYWDRQMEKALKPFIAGIGETVAEQAEVTLG
jgi:phage portal protein BeeE